MDSAHPMQKGVRRKSTNLTFSYCAMDAMRGTRLSEHIPANTSSAVVKRPFNCPAGTTLFALESLLFHLETGTARRRFAHCGRPEAWNGP